MLSGKGPHLNLAWLTPVLVVFVVVVSILVKCFAHLSINRFAVLLMGLVGTVLLASAFEPIIPRQGRGWWDSLKFAVKKFPEYGSPPSFDIVRFYVGLLLLLAGMVWSATVS